MSKCIFIIFLELGIGGVQRKIIDITNYLAHNNSSIKIYILIRRKTSFTFENQIKNKNAEILNYSSWYRFKVPFFFPIFVLWKAFILKPKSILAFLEISSISAVLCKLVFFWRKIRVVLSEDHYATGVYQALGLYRIRALGLRFFYPKANVIFTCSEVTARDLSKNYGIPKEKLRLICNWTFMLKKKIKFTRKKYDFLYVGRLDKLKNTICILKNLKEVRKSKKKTSLCLVGLGTEKKTLKKYAKKNNLSKDVFFKKATENVEKYYAQSKIFVFSPVSKAEGFPLVILEAMAMGVVVLTSKFAGVEEFIEDGKTGLIFDSDKDFVIKAKWLLDNPNKRKIINEKARRCIEIKHSPRNIEQYLKALGVKKDD